MNTRKISSGWIVIIFASLHFLAALLCRYSGISDELILTLLTMAMAAIICDRKDSSIEITAIAIIVVNIIGYIVGTALGKLLDLILPGSLLTAPISTFITTCVLGYGTIFALKSLKGEIFLDHGTRRLGWILSAITGVLLFRAAVSLVLSKALFNDSTTGNLMREVFSSSTILIVVFCSNLLFIRYIHGARHKGMSPWLKSAAVAGFTLVVAVAYTAFAGWHTFFINGRINMNSAIPVFIVMLLCEVLIYAILYAVNEATMFRQAAKDARNRAHLAEFQYIKLKQQVNPHFLFNSLNVLDGLVCEEKIPEASTYIHKLANLYRFMLKTEDQKMITIEEEMAFARGYIDLYKVRFPQGFEVTMDIDDSLLGRYVVPTAIQMLLENALKHNAIGADFPLKISLRISDKGICVSNNIIPKSSSTPSAKVGLNYIKTQYKDISGKDISIIKTDTDYTVTLPIL